MSRKIDHLCVHSHHFKILLTFISVFIYPLNNEKSTCIILMSVVFSKHAAVLVLDKELMTESLYQVT